MKRGNKVILFMSLCVISAIFFLGCGGSGSGPGAPGSSGSADTGIVPRVTVVTHSDPNGDQGDIWEIDLVQDTCTGGTVEKWGNDYAHVTFHGDPINPNVPSTDELFVTNYRVTFFKVNPNLPTIEQMSFSSQTGIYVLPGEDTGPFNFLVFDTGRKIQMQNDLNNLNQVNSSLLYNMEIEMWGQDKYGNNVTFPPIEREIIIADFDHCT